MVAAFLLTITVRAGAVIRKAETANRNVETVIRNAETVDGNAEAVAARKKTVGKNDEVVITVRATGGEDDTDRIREAIGRVAGYNGRPVTLRFEQGNYHLSRAHATEQLYHVSNTTSADENRIPVKHIGLFLKHLKNLTIDGGGAHFITHGEMTTFVVDSCENVVLCNFTLQASDPSLPEITVMQVTDNYALCRTSSDTRYRIRDGRLFWCGEGWEFTGGIAQVFWPERNVTSRTASPMDGLQRAEELEPGLLKLYYAPTPAMKTGEVYQMRHSYRTEVCGFINRSRDITLRDIHFAFLGNFGIVGQYSENLIYDHLECAPLLGTDRTGAGFADFVQMSGCRGRISITDSRFEGAHDDPINIHGTHLKVMEITDRNRVMVRFMHGQTFGFEAFTPGDTVELVNAHTLLAVQTATVEAIRRMDDYTWEITLDRPVTDAVRTVADVVMENVSWTPEVYIARNFFARTPTRGILVTTRRAVVIEHNTFFRIPMSAILVSDDARSWFESGPAHNVTIRGNEFIECGSPVVNIWPEVDTYRGAVHNHITVEGNRFVRPTGLSVAARATDNLVVTDNFFDTVTPMDKLIQTENCNRLKIENNRVRH